MANTVKLESHTLTHNTTDKQKPETQCCQNPRTHGYPEETPVVQICLACGSWNWKKT